MTVSAEDFKGLARASRTCRRFDASKPVSREDMLGLIDTARLAPTGNNLQLLRFHIETEPAVVAHLARSHGWAAALKDFNGPADASELPSAYIAICAKAGTETNPIRLIDCGIAAQTLALAARARGIACCMIRSFKPAVADDLGLSEKGYAPLLLMAFGHPAADEHVVLEDAGAGQSLAYWRTDGNVHHVPKLGVDDLLI